MNRACGGRNPEETTTMAMFRRVLLLTLLLPRQVAAQAYQ